MKTIFEAAGLIAAVAAFAAGLWLLVAEPGFLFSSASTQTSRSVEEAGR